MTAETDADVTDSDEQPVDTEESDADDVTAVIDASTVQATLDAIGALVDECKMHFEEDGLAIRAVDPANVGMVDLKLRDTAFEAYNPPGAVIGVNLERLNDIAGMASGDQMMRMNLLETGKLNIEIDGLTYNLALIDPDSIREEPDVPELDLPGEVVIEANALGRGIKAADMVSDHIRLAVDPDDRTFHMAAEGDTDDVDLNLGEDDLIDLQAGPADSLFSLDYLQDMVKAMPNDVAVTLDLGEEFPVKLHFDYAAGDGHVTYMLAPRIQSD